MTIIEKDLSEIRPYENNPRFNEEAVELVANSIKAFGWKQPIVIDRDGVIVAGHTRYKAALRLGKKTAPCLIADDLTDEQIRAYRLADNKTGEAAEWDFSALEVELDAINMDMEQFGFDFDEDQNEWFERQQKDGAARQDGNDEYNDFLDKFEAKKTTDDCYTPENIYDAVADWAAEEYGLKRENFVRPFYPNGDYQKETYKGSSVVVDNPPFSILAEIIDFYTERGIRFFLFAPALSALGYLSRDRICSVCVGASVTYENGANVATSFVTNMEQEGIAARSAPELFEVIDKANEENLRKIHAQLPKYEFPDEVVTASKLSYMSKYGQNFEVERAESCFIRALDAMKDSGKGIFGGALLLSEKAAAERAAAERAAAERAAAEKRSAQKWKLSDREKGIVKSLGSKAKNDED